jgi:hypothetical protein
VRFDRRPAEPDPTPPDEIRTATWAEHDAVVARAAAGEFVVEQFGWGPRNGEWWFRVRRPKPVEPTLPF